jgi:ferrous iron transport protein A
MAIKLKKAKPGITYTVIAIKGNSETNRFLNNIGLHVGDTITVISKLASTFIINIKDGRFGIDEGMAKLIEVEQ